MIEQERLLCQNQDLRRENQELQERISLQSLCLAEYERRLTRQARRLRLLLWLSCLLLVTLILTAATALSWLR